jgi:hypothetical protein
LHRLRLNQDLGLCHVVCIADFMLMDSKKQSKRICARVVRLDVVSEGQQLHPPEGAATDQKNKDGRAVGMEEAVPEG